MRLTLSQNIDAFGLGDGIFRWYNSDTVGLFFWLVNMLFFLLGTSWYNSDTGGLFFRLVNMLFFR